MDQAKDKHMAVHCAAEQEEQGRHVQVHFDSQVKHRTPQEWVVI